MERWAGEHDCGVLNDNQGGSPTRLLGALHARVDAHCTRCASMDVRNVRAGAGKPQRLLSFLRDSVSSSAALQLSHSGIERSSLLNIS